jgi:hypothetical protein
LFLIYYFKNISAKGLSLLSINFEIGFQSCLNVSEIDIKNHKGASEFSSDIYKYLRKEASYGSIIGLLFYYLNQILLIVSSYN